jgi:hypothetical protein
MHEWPLWRAAPQHLAVAVKGRLGPVVSLGTMSQHVRAILNAQPSIIDLRQHLNAI